MDNEIYRIREISDSHDGEKIVNNLLEKGWKFISACQVGTPEAMDIVYVVGATKDVYEASVAEHSPLTDILRDIESAL